MTDNNEVTEASSASPSFSTLSRTSLYAPLTAYQTGTLQIPKKVAKSHAEVSLLEWLQAHSAGYHQTAKGAPRTTGNRSLSLNDVKEKIMHRSLSMFGRDYASSISTSNPIKPTRLAVQSNTQTRAKHKKRQRRLFPSSKNLMEWKNLPKDQILFLQDLNLMWTKYMKKFLATAVSVSATFNTANGAQPWSSPSSTRGQDKCNHKKTHQDNQEQAILDAIQRHARAIEWVGASVQIRQCTAALPWVGRCGILVATTPQTWLVMNEQVKEQQHQAAEAAAPDNETTNATATLITAKDEEEEHRPPKALNQLLRVPKRGTVLAVFLPLNDTNDYTITSASRDSNHARVIQIQLDGEAAATPK